MAYTIGVNEIILEKLLAQCLAQRGEPINVVQQVNFLINLGVFIWGFGESPFNCSLF